MTKQIRCRCGVNKHDLNTIPFEDQLASWTSATAKQMADDVDAHILETLSEKSKDPK